ncbi:MAG: A24 family peptidase [Candidatus Hadarchaeales archaeon]
MSWAIALAILSAAAYFDIKRRTIPNWLVLPSIVIAFYISAVEGHVWEATFGAGLGAIVSLPALFLGSGGDFKLSIVSGAFWGIKSPPLFFISFASAFLVIKVRKGKLPFAPFILLGHVVGGIVL